MQANTLKRTARLINRRSTVQTLKPILISLLRHIRLRCPFGLLDALPRTVCGVGGVGFHYFLRQK